MRNNSWKKERKKRSANCERRVRGAGSTGSFTGLSCNAVTKVYAPIPPPPPPPPPPPRRALLNHAAWRGGLTDRRGWAVVIRWSSDSNREEELDWCLWTPCRRSVYSDSYVLVCASHFRCLVRDGHSVISFPCHISLAISFQPPTFVKWPDKAKIKKIKKTNK